MFDFDTNSLELGKILINVIQENYGKKAETMDEEQEKYIVGELKSKIASLESRKYNLTLQVANAGNRLWEVMQELDKAENALESLSDEKDINEH
jgi:septal ring factor EnvC (AmiA/AmiB activator)